MRNSLIALAAVLSLALAASFSRAARAADVDINGLLNYQIVIGDTGDRYDDWDNSDTRVYTRVRDERGRTHENYFDSIASAFFVLREKYGTVRVLDLQVPDYSRRRGLIDGSQAYYVWDNEDYARGGVPLILAFSDYRDAQDEAYYRHADVLDFDTLIYNLKQWDQRSRDSRDIYWRGWDSHWDRPHWTSAWNHRWDGYGWDPNRGWLQLRVNIGDNDRHDRGNRNRWDDRGGNSGHNNWNGRGGRDNDRDRGRNNDRDREDRAREQRAREDRDREERARQEREQQDRERREKEERERQRNGNPDGHGRGDGGRHYGGGGNDNHGNGGGGNGNHGNQGGGNGGNGNGGGGGYQRDPNRKPRKR